MQEAVEMPGPEWLYNSKGAKPKIRSSSDLCKRLARLTNALQVKTLELQWSVTKRIPCILFENAIRRTTKRFGRPDLRQLAFHCRRLRRSVPASARCQDEYKASFE